MKAKKKEAFSENVTTSEKAGIGVMSIRRVQRSQKSKKTEKTPKWHLSEGG